MLINQRQAQIQCVSVFAVTELRIESLAATHCYYGSDRDHFTEACGASNEI